MEGRTKLWNFFWENMKCGIQGVSRESLLGTPDTRRGRLTCVGSILPGIKWRASSREQLRPNIMPAAQSRHFTYPGRAGFQPLPLFRAKPGFTKKAKEANSTLKPTNMIMDYTSHNLKSIPNHKKPNDEIWVWVWLWTHSLPASYLEKVKGWNKCKWKAQILFKRRAALWEDPLSTLSPEHSPGHPPLYAKFTKRPTHFQQTEQKWGLPEE